MQLSKQSRKQIRQLRDRYDTWPPAGSRSRNFKKRSRAKTIRRLGKTLSKDDACAG